jgi:hypothetical protein
MPTLSKAVRKELQEKLLETYPGLEEQVCDILLDVYEKDSQWLCDRMHAEMRKEKIAAKSSKPKPDEQQQQPSKQLVPTPEA